MMPLFYFLFFLFFYSGINGTYTFDIYVKQSKTKPLPAYMSFIKYPYVNLPTELLYI